MKNLQQEILARSDYHRGLLNFIENNPGCTSDDMFNSGVANAIIPVGIRQQAIEIWIKQMILNGEIESRNRKLYSTGQTDWHGHNIIKKEVSMRLTKNSLKKLVLEELEKLEYEIEKKKTDMMLDKDHPHDVEAQEDSWAGGANIHHNIDHAEVMYGEPTTKALEALKVFQLSETYRRLRREFLNEAMMKDLYMDMMDDVLDYMITNMESPKTAHIDDLLDMFRTKYPEHEIEVLHNVLEDLEDQGAIELEGSSGFYHIVDAGIPDYIGGMLGEAKSFPWYESKMPDFQITSLAGMDRFGDHSTLFGNIKDHSEDEPGVLDMIIDWAHEVDATYSERLEQQEDALYLDYGLQYNDPEYKEAMQGWLADNRKDWMSQYSRSGAAEVIPERVWGALFDYIVEESMSPDEFLKNVYSARR